MFISNKYLTIYFSIINRAKSRVISPNTYTEKHHTIPRSLGGTNDPSNIALLTGREHFICHRLLPKFTTGKDKTKMLYAIWKMCHSSKKRKHLFKLTSRTYSIIKNEMKHSRSSEDFTPEWKQKISNTKKFQTIGAENPMYGKTHSIESRTKISVARKLRTSDPNWNIRPPCKKETAKKIKEANTGKKWVHNCYGERRYVSGDEFNILTINGWLPGVGTGRKTINLVCSHCNKEVDAANFTRWHGDKCKSAPFNSKV